MADRLFVECLMYCGYTTSAPVVIRTTANGEMDLVSINYDCGQKYIEVISDSKTGVYDIYFDTECFMNDYEDSKTLLIAIMRDNPDMFCVQRCS
jgi:hypothetical protein